MSVFATADQQIPGENAHVAKPRRSAPTSAVESPGPVDVATVLNAVDQHRLIFFEDLVDDPVVPAPGGPETFEFTDKWLPEPLGVLGDRPEDGRECGVPNLVRQSVEVAQTLGGDLDLIHEVGSDVVAQAKPFALGRFPP